MAGLARHSQFEQMVAANGSGMLRFARWLVPDAASAEDLVQDAFLLAWRGFDQFCEGTNARAWLTRILLNLIRSRGRQIQRRPVLVPIDGNFGTIESVHGCDNRIDILETRRAFACLSEEHRAVLLLAVVQGFTCAEIARLLHLPIGTVMSRLDRARRALRLKLEPVCQAVSVGIGEK